MSVRPAVARALQACPYDSQDFYDLCSLVKAHTNERSQWDTMTSPLAEEVAAALDDCSHMGPEFVALFYAVRDAMFPGDRARLRYTALRIAEARGLAPTREALDTDLDEFLAHTANPSGPKDMYEFRASAQVEESDSDSKGSAPHYKALNMALSASRMEAGPVGTRVYNESKCI